MLLRLNNREVLSSVYPVARHLVPIIFLIFYSFIGGWIFVQLESPDYHKFRHFNKSAVSSSPTELYWKLLFENFVNNLTIILKQYDTDKNDKIKTTAASVLGGKILAYIQKEDTVLRSRTSYEQPSLEILISKLVKEFVPEDDKQSLSEKQYTDVQNPWNIWSATLYAATLYTTIGYGNIACQTVAGRVATMVYAILGIPLLLTVLSDLGSLLFQALEQLHVKIRYLLWRFKNYELPDNVSEISFSSAFLLLVVWMCASAGIFLIWEKNWDYFTSFYFFFITFTTIGLGDVTPDEPHYTLGAFIFILCGLAIVSMFITIIQSKVEQLFQSLMTNIDTEYRQKVLDPTHSKMEDDTCKTGVGVMKLYKQKPLRERILFSLMDKYKKDMLEQYWRKKSGTKNKYAQTEPKVYRHQELQVDIETEEETKRKFRKYIYNLDD